MDEKIVEVAMEIIVSAGAARKRATEAMSIELEGNKNKADECLREADEAIKKAHNAQTDVIQDETRGIKTELSLLFIHAQDTVMTISSEVNLIKLMIKMNRKLEEKINGNNK